MSEENKKSAEEQQFSEDSFGGIFDLTEDQITVDDGRGVERNPDFYGPSLRNSNVKEDFYKSRIRFVPNVLDKNLTIVPKWIYYLPDPENPEGNFYADCPSNFQGKGARGNILSTAFFHLKDDESAVMREIAKSYFSRKRYYFSLVQIMIDSFEPDDEGKVKIFRFGKQVYNMIEREKNDDPKVGHKGIIPYSPFEGKDFILWIYKKQIDERKTITSYDKSYFDDKITAMSFDKGETRLEETDENKKKIFQFLKENSPDLSQCVAKEWDTHMEQKVIESVKSVIGNSAIFDVIYKKAYGEKAMYTSPAEEAKDEKVQEQPMGNTETAVEKETAVEEKGKSLEEKVAESKEKKKETAPESSDDKEFDNLDDLDFNNIDG